MEEKKYTMAELLAEEDARLAKEAKEAEERRKAEEARIKEEKERKHQEYLIEKEKRHQAYLEEKERRHQEWLAEKERRHQEWLAEKERRANTFEDRTLTCKKCGKEWIWTASEQKFYKDKGFFRPSMCKECRASIKVINNFHK